MYFYFNFWLSIPLIRTGYQPKMLDPDPYQMNTDPEHCFFGPRNRFRDVKNKHPRSCFRELFNSFFGLKYFNSFLRIQIRCLFDPGSGTEKLEQNALRAWPEKIRTRIFSGCRIFYRSFLTYITEFFLACRPVLRIRIRCLFYPGPGSGISDTNPIFLRA